MKKVYTIFAGINGAGKTSLYNVLKAEGELGERINLDEMVNESGDWRDSILQIRTAVAAMRRINDCIERGVSFHQETVIPGATIERQIKRAKGAGYSVQLLFVGIADVELALARVEKRIAQGGHGIEEKVLRKRFEKLSPSLRKILPLCDRVVCYDNTLRFRQLAVLRDKIMLDCDTDLPPWFADIF